MFQRIYPKKGLHCFFFAEVLTITCNFKGKLQPRPQGAFPALKPGKSALGTRLGKTLV